MRENPGEHQEEAQEFTGWVKDSPFEKGKALEIADLTKYYGEVRGVENLSLNVEEGELFGFIGPNGAGKSTTIRTLLGLIKATSGSAQILGMDYVKDRIDIMKHIGYLPSEVNLYGQLSGIAFLKYASKFYGDIDEKRINELAQWFEFDLSRPIEDLSFGNKKKIGIIQALLHRPKLLIMDEPTGGLDPLMQARFFELLKMENEKGTTIFFSSHTLSEVQRYCEKVAVIRDGHILEVSTVDKLRQKQLKKVRLSLEKEETQVTNIQDTRRRNKEMFMNSLRIQGVYDLEYLQNGTYTFDFDGAFPELFEVLSKWPIKGFTMEEPALEEIFMHYYTKAGDA